MRMYELTNIQKNYYYGNKLSSEDFETKPYWLLQFTHRIQHNGMELTDLLQFYSTDIDAVQRFKIGEDYFVSDIVRALEV